MSQALVDSLHDLPRYGYDTTIQYIGASWSTWNSYVNGAAFNPAIMGGVGFLAALVALFVYASVCCCRCCRCCAPMKGKEGALCAPRVYPPSPCAPYDLSVLASARVACLPVRLC